METSGASARLIETAKGLLDSGQIGSAEQLLAEVLASDTPPSDALRLSIRAARQQGDLARAAERALAASTLYPEDAGFIITRSEVLREMGRAPDAAIVLEAVPDALRDRPGIQVQRALCARDSGDYDGALRLLAEVQHRTPGMGGLGVEIGRTLLVAGRLAEAEAACRAALEKSAAQPAAWLCLADIALAAESWSTALELLSSAVAANPGHPRLAIRLIETLRTQGRAADALTLTTQWIATTSTEDLFLLHAELLADTVSTSAALEFYAETVRPRFSSARVVACHASLLGQFGLIEQGANECRTALAASGNDFWLVMMLISLVIAGGRPGELEGLWAQAEPSTPAQQKALTRLRAKALEWSGQRALALPLLEGDDATDPERNAALVRLHLRDGNRLALQRVLVNEAVALAPLRRARGLPSNPTQSIAGQILMESQCIRPLDDPMPPDSPEARRQTVLAHPEDTAAAIAFLVPLIADGDLPLHAGPSAIPRRVLMYWDASEPPEDIGSIMAHNAAALAGFEITRFDRDDADRFLRAQFGADMAAVFWRCRNPAQASDLLRLAWLSVHGGVYIDTDDRVIGDLGPLLAGRELVLYQEDLGSIGNNFMAVVPGHPLIGAALDRAVEHVRRGDTDSIWLSTGPGLITRLVAGQLARGEIDALRVITHVQLRRFVAIHCKAAYKTGRHWSDAEFRKRIVPLSPPPPPPPLPARPAVPLPEGKPMTAWSVRRIHKIRDIIGAHTYLEIGVSAGNTFHAVDITCKDAVDPAFKFDHHPLGTDRVRYFNEKSDAFWAGGKARIYDLIFIDGLHTYEQTLRDFLCSLRYAHARTVWIIDDTIPSDLLSSLPNQNLSYRERKRLKVEGMPWHGDVYKVVPTLHDFLPTVELGTITEPGNPQTIVWYGTGRTNIPAAGNLEQLSRMNFFDIDGAMAKFYPGTEDEVMARLANAFAEAPDAP